MKKAKILLATIAVVGVLGGTFAFKAAKRGALTYFTTHDPGVAAPAANSILKGVIGSAGTLQYWTTDAGTIPVNYDKVLSGN